MASEIILFFIIKLFSKQSDVIQKNDIFAFSLKQVFIQIYVTEKLEKMYPGV